MAICPIVHLLARHDKKKLLNDEVWMKSPCVRCWEIDWLAYLLANGIQPVFCGIWCFELWDPKRRL